MSRPLWTGSVVHRPCGAPAASIAELLMGSPLANQLKAQLPEDFRHFPRLENRC